MKLTLSLTQRCNLSCAYCYAGKTEGADMSESTLRRSLERVLEYLPPKAPLEVAFFGGEPLLRFDLIETAVAFLRSHPAAAGRALSLRLTTNGTRLSEEMLAFLTAEQVAVCVSVDGPPGLHDARRQFRGGRGSYATVVRNIARARERLADLQLNAVYGPEDLPNLAEIVASLTPLEPNAIHLNPNIRADWSHCDVAAFAPAFERLADFYMDSFRAGREIGLNVVDGKLMVFAKGGYGAADRCGMGVRELAVAPSGNLYGCERLIGDDTGGPFYLGNIHLNPALGCRCNPVRQARPTPCERCTLAPYCVHWCGCTNHSFTGDTAVPGPVLCAGEQAAIRAAARVLATLAEEENPVFTRHALNYFGASPTHDDR